jgi:hypothetical protein
MAISGILSSQNHYNQRASGLWPTSFYVEIVLGRRAIFAFGAPDSGLTSVSNIVSNTGVVGNDVAGVGTGRYALGAAGYGTDKAIFGYGNTGSSTSITNLVSNTGVVATDTSGVGTARYSIAGASYGSSGQAMFGFGFVTSPGLATVSMVNLVSNTGVVSTDTSTSATTRQSPGSASYGGDKAIFGYGSNWDNWPGTPISQLSSTNLVSNTGVVASNTAGVGTARGSLAGTSYGSSGQAMFAFGSGGGPTNLVSNTGVVASDVNRVGTNRTGVAAAPFGSSGQAIFGYGNVEGYVTGVTNLVSNTGVVANDVAVVGTARQQPAAASFG